MRSSLKRLAEAAGTAGGLAALARRRAPDAIAVLAFHNVVPEEEAGRGDASLHLPLPRFLEQIERVTRTHEVVDLRTLSSSSRRPRAIITFDDAYRGAVTLALPELERRGLPAVVFVAPGLLGAHATWWDALGAAGLLDEERRARALTQHAGRGEAVLRAMLPRETPRLPASYGIVTEEELRAGCGALVALGSHTWEHEYLPVLGPTELSSTLERSLRWVAGQGDAALAWLALPYGGGSEALGRAALACGYTGVLRIEGGLWRAGAARSWVPRINVPAGLSSRGLELRASGVTRDLLDSLTRRSAAPAR